MRPLALVTIVGWALLPATAPADDHVVWGCENAGYAGETTEYRHGVLGDDIEYKTLVLKVPTGVGTIEATLDLPEGQVFEDVAPRCGDLDGDGVDEVITVISDARDGARLAVFSPRTGPVAETPAIGQGFRWLAPVGIADLNRDGLNDVAYVDRPHLAGVLRVWTLRDGELAEFASTAGFSNHRIGEDFITGGVRDCGDGPELVLPNFDWSRLMSVTFGEEGLQAVAIGNTTDPDAVEAALACKD